MDAREMNALRYVNSEKNDEKRKQAASREERDFWKRINQKVLDFLDMM